MIKLNSYMRILKGEQYDNNLWLARDKGNIFR